MSSRGDAPLTGYLHPLYAESLADFGVPRALPNSGGWILDRQIPGVPERDAIGCYPLFACKDWQRLEADLDALENKLVSISLVPDPFGDYDLEELKTTFKDIAIPFKKHFVVDLSEPRESIVSKHHAYYARRALRQTGVEVSSSPVEFLDDWAALYARLSERHHITGIRRFSRAAFAIQLTVPGVVMFRAIHKGETVGAHIWYVHGKVATSHLAAFSPRGYELMASYGLYSEAIDHFAGQIRYLNLGGGAGIRHDANDGLTKFKRGWSTETRDAYFCGRILNRPRYAEIVESSRIPNTGLFPAYRLGEFEGKPR